MKVTSYFGAAAVALAAFVPHTTAMADDIVFTASIPSGAVQTDIRDIGIDFPDFSYVGVDPELCDVSFGDRKLTAYLDYELMLVDGGAAFFGISFPAPLTADTPTELSILLNPDCISLWNRGSSDESIRVTTPLRLTYTVAPGGTDDVALSLASVTTPNDKGELAFVVDGMTRSYHRFYLRADMPGLAVVASEAPNVTLSGPEGYSAATRLMQAYGTTGDASYFYFDIEEEPSATGEYTLVVSANAVADALRLKNPEFGHANPDTGITFKMVENGSGVEQITADENASSRTSYNLSGVRVSPGETRGVITVTEDGTKILR